MKAQDIIDFAKVIGKSKRIKRAGWIREGIDNSESIAEHCFRLIVLAMVLAPFLNVDKEKLVKMAIIHDLGETETGDIVVERGATVDKELRQKKEKQEEEILTKMLGVFGEEYHLVFHELISRESKEAKIFWQLDKLEMVIQASEYEEEQHKNLEEFFINADLHISDKKLREIFQLLRR